MRSGMKCMDSAAEVKAEAMRWIGQHLQFTDEKRKGGTTHFHADTTADVVQDGQRYTLAMTPVRDDENVKPVVQRLVQQLRALILRNVWVWRHFNGLAIRRGPGIFLRNDLLRLRKMTLRLEYPVATEFGLVLTKIIPSRQPHPSRRRPGRETLELLKLGCQSEDSLYVRADGS